MTTNINLATRAAIANYMIEQHATSNAAWHNLIQDTPMQRVLIAILYDVYGQEHALNEIFDPKFVSDSTALFATISTESLLHDGEIYVDLMRKRDLEEPDSLAAHALDNELLWLLHYPARGDTNIESHYERGSWARDAVSAYEKAHDSDDPAELLADFGAWLYAAGENYHAIFAKALAWVEEDLAKNFRPRWGYIPPGERDVLLETTTNADNMSVVANYLSALYGRNGFGHNWRFPKNWIEDWKERDEVGRIDASRCWALNNLTEADAEEA